MITREEISQELNKIAEMLFLAKPTIEWGGKDEANEGKPGKLDKDLSEILKSLPITWDMDGATFSLSKIRKLDEKGIGGRSTWVWAKLPGKYEGTDLTFNIYRTGKITKYHFTLGNKETHKISNLSHVEELFNSLIQKEGDSFKTTKDLLKEAYDLLYKNKGDISKKIKEGPLKEIEDPLNLTLAKNETQHYIYMYFFLPISEIKKETQESVLQKLDKGSEEVIKIVKDVLKNLDLNRIKITAKERERKLQGVGDTLALGLTLKFLSAPKKE